MLVSQPEQPTRARPQPINAVPDAMLCLVSMISRGVPAEDCSVTSTRRTHDHVHRFRARRRPCRAHHSCRPLSTGAKTDKLVIDFGTDFGTRKSSAQLTEHYRPEELIGRLVLAVVNFPARQIGPFMSEVLTLGLPDSEGAVYGRSG